MRRANRFDRWLEQMSRPECGRTDCHAAPTWRGSVNVDDYRTLEIELCEKHRAEAMREGRA